MSDDMSQMTCDSHKRLSLGSQHIAELIWNLIRNLLTRPPLPKYSFNYFNYSLLWWATGGGRAANKGCNNKATFVSRTLQGRFYWMQDMNFIGCEFH